MSMTKRGKKGGIIVAICLQTNQGLVLYLHVYKHM